MTRNPNQQSIPDWKSELERAQAERNRLRTASRRVAGALHAVAELYGPASRVVLEQHYTAIYEHADEGMGHYERAARDLQREVTQGLNGMAALRDEVGRMKQAAWRAQDELIRRYRNANRPLPDWLEEDLTLCGHPEGAPF